MTLWNDLLRTRETGWVILVRLLVGLVVFFPEGLQKLFFPELLGAGRFAKIGIPYADLMGPFVGVVEIVCGALVIVGLFTRLAAIPLLTMIVAVVSTRVPILLGHDFWIFHPEADALRLPEHAARGARRFRHAARLALPADRRRWRMVA